MGPLEWKTWEKAIKIKINATSKSPGGRYKLLKDMKMSIKIPALKAPVENSLSIYNLFKEVRNNAGGDSQLNAAAIRKIKEYGIIETEASKKLVSWETQFELVEMVISVVMGCSDFKKITDSLVEAIVNHGLISKFCSELKEMLSKQLLFNSTNPYNTSVDELTEKSILEASAQAVLE